MDVDKQIKKGRDTNRNSALSNCRVMSIGVALTNQHLDRKQVHGYS